MRRIVMIKWIALFVLLFFALLAVFHAQPVTSPAECHLSASSFYAFIQCLDSMIITEMLDGPKFSMQVLKDYRTVALKIMKSNSTNDCNSIALPPSISENTQSSTFHDSTVDREFCILYETTTSDTGEFKYGFGVFAAPLSTDSADAEIVHVSAAHPQTDGPVHLQAAYVFAHLPISRSFAMPGIIRNASNAVNDCQDNNYVADAAHNNQLPFYSMLRGVEDWQRAQLGRKQHAFVQFHGMAREHCTSMDFFVSPGISGKLQDFYNASHDRPYYRIYSEINKNTEWKASIPSERGVCNLVASSNVFGRLLNGVAEDDVCDTAPQSTPALQSGASFVHIEQHIDSLQPPRLSYERWVSVLQQAMVSDGLIYVAFPCVWLITSLITALLIFG